MPDLIDRRLYATTEGAAAVGALLAGIAAALARLDGWPLVAAIGLLVAGSVGLAWVRQRAKVDAAKVVALLMFAPAVAWGAPEVTAGSLLAGIAWDALPVALALAIVVGVAMLRARWRRGV